MLKTTKKMDRGGKEREERGGERGRKAENLDLRSQDPG